jgi:hypothetical protein
MEFTESELDPRTALDLIAATRTRTKRSLDINGALLYGAWGLAWLIGYGAIWLSVRGHPIYRAPAAWAFLVLGACMVAALVTTMMTVGRSMQGITGSSSRSGRLYGWAWAISFCCLFSLISGLAHAGASELVIGLFASAGPALVVALIYLVSGALWNDRTMFVLGVCLALAMAIAVFFGVVTLDLILAIAGGGAFLLAAMYEARLRRP